MLAVVSLLGVLFLALLIWMIGASEQLRVGQNLLERRRTLGKLQRVQRWEGLAGAHFRVSRYETSGRDGYHVYRRLHVSGKRGRALLDSYKVTNHMTVGGDEAGALGRFLAHITGWTLLGV